MSVAFLLPVQGIREHSVECAGANRELIMLSFTRLVPLALAAHKHPKAEVHVSGNKVVCHGWHLFAWFVNPTVLTNSK